MIYSYMGVQIFGLSERTHATRISAWDKPTIGVVCFHMRVEGAAAGEFFPTNTAFLSFLRG